MHNGLQRFTSLPLHFSTSRYINFQKNFNLPDTRFWTLPHLSTFTSLHSLLLFVTSSFSFSQICPLFPFLTPFFSFLCQTSLTFTSLILFLFFSSSCHIHVSFLFFIATPPSCHHHRDLYFKCLYFFRFVRWLSFLVCILR